MTTKALVYPFVVLSAFLEFIFKPFVRRHQPPVPEVETPPEIFESDAKEVVRDLSKDVPPSKPAEEPPRNKSEIVATNGICLRKSVHFRTRAGDLRSAKVMGYSWEDDGHFLVLSRKNGPLFKRRLC